MPDDDRRGVGEDSALEHLTRMHSGVPECSATDDVGVRDGVPRIEVERHEVLAIGLADELHEDRSGVARLAKRRTPL